MIILFSDLKGKCNNLMPLSAQYGWFIVLLEYNFHNFFCKLNFFYIS